MINSLIAKLNSFNEIKDYRIIKVKENNHEIYYIGDKVETVRNASLSSSLNVTVYCDYGNLRGQANFTIFDSYSDEEVIAKIKDAIYRTNFSKNTFFNLPSGQTRTYGTKQEPISNEVLFKIGEAVIEGSKGYSNGWISSFEVFLKEKETRIINSQGVNCTYYTNSLSIEIIPTFKDSEGLEIELYNNLEYALVDYDKIRKATEEIMHNASLRNEAVKYTGPSNIKVLLSAPEIKEIMSNLINNLEYSNVYNKMNLLNVGDKFYGDNHDDAPNILLVPNVTDSISNRPIDSDGIILHDTPIVKENEIVTTHGDNRFANYLGIKDPTGQLPNIYLEDGSYSELQLKAMPHLHCIYFSSFQFDIYSGNFGGEVRLAKYFDGEKYIPVTGLTIGGNIHELKSHLKFSNSRENINGYSGPKYVLIDSMNSN